MDLGDSTATTTTTAAPNEEEYQGKKRVLRWIEDRLHALLPAALREKAHLRDRLAWLKIDLLNESKNDLSRMDRTQRHELRELCKHWQHLNQPELAEPSSDVRDQFQGLYTSLYSYRVVYRLVCSTIRRLQRGVESAAGKQ